MNCPRCKTALERKPVKGFVTEIDRCPKCEGFWFDDGELREILGGAPAKSLVSVPANARERNDEPCPRCSKPLFAFAYPGTMTVVEGCRTCRGLWLESGEFQEIRKIQGGSSMTCPKCGTAQPKGETCRSCGVVIQKFVESARRERVAATEPVERVPLSRRPLTPEIPGVKGKMIHFIDRSLSTMLELIRG